VRFSKALSVFAVAVATTLLTAGCSLGAKADQQQPTAGKEAQDGQPAAGEVPRGKPDELGSVIATREVQFSDGGKIVPVKVELYGPRRDQGFVTVKVRMTNMTPEGQGSLLGWQVNAAFAGETKGPHGSDTFSGVYLLDRKNHKQYLVAHNARDEFLASNRLGALFVKPQQSAELFATFGAPPDEVAVVDVVIPQIPVFENVSLA